MKSESQEEKEMRKNLETQLTEALEKIKSLETQLNEALEKIKNLKGQVLKSKSQNDKKQQSKYHPVKRKMSKEMYEKWMDAVDRGDIEEMRFYINQHYEVDAHYPGKYSDSTALVRTALCNNDGCIYIAKLLLENGADPNFKKGKPLDNAICNHRPDMVELLLENGADPNIKLRWREKSYPLIEAVKDIVQTNKNSFEEKYLGLLEIIKLLIKHAADKNLTDEDGKTALMIAARAGEIKIAELLLKKSEDLNAEVVDMLLPRKNNIPRSSAWVSEKSESLLKVIPIDINAQDEDGYTALMLAARNGHDRMVQLLLKHGADVSIKGKKGESVLNCARSSGNDKIVGIVKDAIAKSEAKAKAKNNLNHEKGA